MSSSKSREGRRKRVKNRAGGNKIRDLSQSLFLDIRIRPDTCGMDPWPYPLESLICHWAMGYLLIINDDYIFDR
jgi:hypothetical protein